MANFETPFANTGPRRTPTADEKANGFPCGPADQTLFNGMFHRIEAELGNVIAAAGLTPSDGDNAQVQKAIAALIDAATGGGETSSYLLMSQAMARLPFYPEVMSADGVIGITAPVTGTVRVPGGVNILHRGINLVLTEQTDFATIASRTYHLRWNPTDGFTLNYLQDAVYNPGGLAETDASFDSTFDDMLLARIVTNSSNVATITSLANKHRLFAEGEWLGANAWQNVNNLSGITDYEPIALNWARRPRSRMSAGINLTTESGTSSGEVNMGAKTLSRYTIAVFWQRTHIAGTSTICWQAEA